MMSMPTLVAYIGAALLEIAGCFAFWSVVRLNASIWWLAPGMVSLAAFGWLLTQVEIDLAGRAYAAYGGIYIIASLVWLWTIEGRAPDRWDLIGATTCMVGALIIIGAPRGAT